MTKRILIRYGDLTLKGKNKKKFIDTAIRRIKERLGEKASYTPNHDRLYVDVDVDDEARVINILKKIPGLVSVSPVTVVNSEVETIIDQAVYEAKTWDENATFKVEVKRANKRFSPNSPELQKILGGAVLKARTDLTVDVHTPDYTLNVEIRDDATYIFSRVYEGIGGFPVGTMGKGIALLSGGIDSPVAAYLAMTKGIDVHMMHFESTPLTSIESAQKAIDLSRQLAVYGKSQRVILHMVPFTALHQAILNKVPEPYHITIMRRMMMRIAERYANLDYTPVLINGESIGQVASQTLESMKVSEMVSSIPVLRPLITMDKNPVIDIARAIGTFEISKRPFEDCCAVYVPSQPATKPRDYYAKRYERLFDGETLIKEAIASTRTLRINSETTIDLSEKGFTVSDALEGYDDYIETK